MTLEQIVSTRKRLIFLNLIVGVLLFFLIEGISSTISVAIEAFTPERPVERKHTQYDEEIGWVSLPNLDVKDLYGPGVFFKTNSLGFRNDTDFDFDVPANKIRVICSGDSFTLGLGVNNDQTWCKSLEYIDGRIESVNLGEGGYGVDQAYLWYRRNSGKLKHDIHIFAFITPDFDRMQSDTFWDKGKPLLVLENGTLVNKNRPAPKSSFKARFSKVRRAVAHLNIVKAANRILLGKHPPDSITSVEKEKQAREVAVRIFEDLAKISKSNNDTLVLVYLPTRDDFMGTQSEAWRQFLLDELRKRGLLFIDLIDEFRTLPPQEVRTLFDDNHNHYSEKGNSYIAALLYKKLLAIPGIKLKGATPGLQPPNW